MIGWSKKLVKLRNSLTNMMKKFYDAVKGVYGPSTRGTSPLLSTDGTKLISDRNEILNRWVEHFNELLNRASTVQQNSVDNIKQQPVQERLADRPTKAEIRKAIKLLQSGKVWNAISAKT